MIQMLCVDSMAQILFCSFDVQFRRPKSGKLCVTVHAERDQLVLTYPKVPLPAKTRKRLLRDVS
jgi:hypothetical protein